MNKERVSAFFDAVLAIIMTILILELEVPKELSLAGLVDLAPNLFAYTLSFFWLGTMWVGIHNTWHKVKKISSQTVWSLLLLMFFASFFPYTTKIVDTTKIVAAHFNNSFAQVMYGVIAILVSICVTWSHRTVLKADPDNTELAQDVRSGLFLFYIDLLVKGIGLLLAITVYPPAMMYSILIAGFAIILPHRVGTDIRR